MKTLTRSPDGGCVTVAVTQKLIRQGKIKEDDVTVIAITGNGLKTQEAIQDHLVKPQVISAKLSEFENTIFCDQPTVYPGAKK